MAPNVGLGTQGPDQEGWSLWITSVVAVVIAALFVAARLAQRWIKSNLGLDDYMIIASLVVSGLLSMCECQAVVYGYGQKWDNLGPETRITARKWFYGAQITYKSVLMLSKISIVCLYYRIFAVSSLKFRRVCHGVNVFIITANMAFIIGTVFQCQPISLFWDKSIKGTCFKEEPWWVSYSVVQIVTDVVLLALPTHQVLSLSMTRTEKLGLFVVFATGLFVTFASIFRTTTVARSAADQDPTQGPIPATVWSVIEANAGIICACLPMLRQPFVRILSPFLPSNHSRSRSTQRSYVLASRNNRQSAFPPHPSGKRDPFGPGEFSPERERGSGAGSEEHSIESAGPATPGTAPGSQRGILVKNEVVVMNGGRWEMLQKKQEQKQQQGQAQGQGLVRELSQDDAETMTTERLQSVAVSSVKDDKDSGKSTFVHV